MLVKKALSTEPTFPNSANQWKLFYSCEKME